MRSNGFTLIELVITVAVIGIASTVVAMISSNALTMYELSRIERADEDNRRRGNALMKFAVQEFNSRLPPPYTGGGFTSAVANPASSVLMGYFTQEGIIGSKVNTDGSAAERVVVYQRISQNDRVSIFGASGEQVIITYDVGVVYQTGCPFADTSCNPNPLTSIPGESQVITTANQTAWDVSGEDARPYMFSTYVAQVNAVKETASRMMRVRDALREYFNAARLAAGAGDQTNFYPAPNGAGAPNMSGAVSTTSEGCEDGWYQLDASNVNVLAQIGLQPVSVYGQTVFGGAIEYCRDFDPAGAGENAVPHNAALRINRTQSFGGDPVSTGGNVIISL